jgi:hypothetical protein
MIRLRDLITETARVEVYDYLRQHIDTPGCTRHVNTVESLDSQICILRTVYAVSQHQVTKYTTASRSTGV